jgi:acyl-coenzyme A synthetase/AMP-(fatty) acid ligase
MPEHASAQGPAIEDWYLEERRFRPSEELTWRSLVTLEEVARFANVLKSLGVESGDRVCIYMPMIPELPVAMLACARIGVPHSVSGVWTTS